MGEIYLRKPKIQMVGGCASAFVDEAAEQHVPESHNDGNEVVLTKGSETGALLEGFLATIIRETGASAAIVRILSPGGQQLRVIAGTGLLAAVYQNEGVADAGCGVCGKSAKSRTIESSDAEFCKSRYGPDFFGDACKYVLAVPLGSGGKKSEPAGVMTLYFALEQKVTSDMKRALQTYAELVHIALKSVWQNEDKHQNNLLSERQSIANEIHDSLAQTLYFAKMRSSLLLDAMKTGNELLAFKCAQDIDEALEGSQKTVRELVTHFRCKMDARGLKFALQKLANDFLARTNIALEFVDQVEKFNLPLEYELQIFLIVRESLFNIATHSGASTARLSVISNNNQYQFIVEDNGGGVASGAPPEGHYGLEIMHERALRVGGEVEIKSLPGQGTRVQLTVAATEV